MKLNPAFVKRNIMGEIILVPTAQAAGVYNGLLALNEVGSFLFDLLPQTDDVDLLAEKVCEEFEVDRDTAHRDTLLFLKQLREQKVILD